MRAIRYWVDKWAVLRVYSRPPLYGPALVSSFDGILALMCALHTIVAAYLISVSGIVYPDVRKHVENNGMAHEITFNRALGWPLNITAAVAVFLVLYKYTWTIQSLIKLLATIVHKLCRKKIVIDPAVDVPILHELPLKTQQSIVNRMESLPAYKKSDTGNETCIYSSGDPVEGFYFVESGVVEILRSLDANPINLIGAGDCFGEDLLFAQGPNGEAVQRKTFARRATDVVQLRYLAKSSLKEVIEASTGTVNIQNVMQNKILHRNHCPPFKEAFDQGLVANINDSYDVQDFDQMDLLRTEFTRKLQKGAEQQPFDKQGGAAGELYKRVCAAVQLAGSAAPPGLEPQP